MLEFTFAISVVYRGGDLLAKLLMHNCVCAKHAKICKFSVHWILQVHLVGKKVHIIHTFNSNILTYIICLISTSPRNDSKIKKKIFVKYIYW